MTVTLHDEILIRRYLLGNITDDEQRRVEERLMADDHYYDCLCKAEADLIDEYVRGALAPDDRLRFERHFFNAPNRRESVAFAGVLNACLSARISQSAATEASMAQLNAPVTHLSRSRSLNLRMAMPYISTFIAVALASVVALLLIKTAELRKQIEQFQVERAALDQREGSLQMRLADQVARSNSLAQELERERAESSRRAQEPVSRQVPTAKPVQLAVASLAPGRSRGEESTQTVMLSPRTRLVQLTLTIGDPLFDQFSAEVQTAESKTVRTLTNLKPGTTDGRTVVITVPARLLTRSDYIIALSGVADNGDRKRVATYFFNVVRK